jgi:acyl-CoA thioesterase
MFAAEPDPLVLAHEVGRAMYARDRTSQFLGIRLDEIGPGYARMHMKVSEHMVNSHDICHGGFIFTLADTTFAYSCNSYNHNAVASGCSIEFLTPAYRGDTLHAKGTEQALAGRSGIYDIEVTNQDGRRIALFRGKSQRIKGEVVARPEQTDQ